VNAEVYKNILTSLVALTPVFFTMIPHHATGPNRWVHTVCAYVYFLILCLLLNILHNNSQCKTIYRNNSSVGQAVS
jgi:hypothetical protein